MSPLDRIQISLNHFQTTLNNLDNIGVDANKNPIVTPKLFRILLEDFQNLYNRKIYFTLHFQNPERFNQFFEKLKEQVTYFSKQYKLFLKTNSVSVLKIENLINNKIEFQNICDGLKKEISETQNKKINSEDTITSYCFSTYAEILRVEQLINLVSKYKSNDYYYVLPGYYKNYYVLPEFYKNFFELARNPFCDFLSNYMKSFENEDSDEEDEKSADVLKTIRYLFYLNKFSKQEYESIFRYVFYRKNSRTLSYLEAFNKELFFAETVYQGAFKSWSQNAVQLTEIVSSEVHPVLNTYFGPAEIITEYLDPSEHIDFFEFCMNHEWQLLIEESVE